jgi:hypothetical protein
MKKHQNVLLLTLFYSCISSSCFSQSNPRLVLMDTIVADNIIIASTTFDKGRGNTSMNFDSNDIYKWSGESSFKKESWGYFDTNGKEIPYIKRDRDLGQTFKYDLPKTSYLKAITVRLSFGSNVVRSGMYGQLLSIQLFEVSGTPLLNNNRTDSTSEGLHGYPHDRPGRSISHERDDYLEGERYKSIAVIRGYRFPSMSDFGFTRETKSVSPDDRLLKGKFLRFAIPADQKIQLIPGKTYAFLLIIDEIGFDRGFALANSYYGFYPGGHAIRRDGDGLFPPVPADISVDFKSSKNKKAYPSAHFPNKFSKRIGIPPGTNGYPDVDTWRDLCFYIEAR